MELSAALAPEKEIGTPYIWHYKIFCVNVWIIGGSNKELSTLEKISMVRFNNLCEVLKYLRFLFRMKPAYFFIPFEPCHLFA